MFDPSSRARVTPVLSVSRELDLAIYRDAPPMPSAWLWLAIAAWAIIITVLDVAL